MSPSSSYEREQLAYYLRELDDTLTRKIRSYPGIPATLLTIDHILLDIDLTFLSSLS